MELNYTLIGARIKKIRKSQNITQDRLSEMAGISPQHLSQIESANDYARGYSRPNSNIKHTLKYCFFNHTEKTEP